MTGETREFLEHQHPYAEMAPERLEAITRAARKTTIIADTSTTRPTTRKAARRAINMTSRAGSVFRFFLAIYSPAFRRSVSPTRETLPAPRVRITSPG